MSRQTPARLLGAALMLTAAACHVPLGPGEALQLDDPGSVARALLSPALDPDDLDRLAMLVASGPLEAHRAELADALLALGASGPPRVLLVEPLDGLGRAAVELELPLAGDGTARVALDLARDRQETTRWRVGWFAGAGVEWPPPGTGRGTGLTTSAGPTADDSRR